MHNILTIRIVNKFFNVCIFMLFTSSWSCEDIHKSKSDGFMKVIDIGKNDSAEFAVQTLDGGYIILVRTDYSSNSCLLIKTDNQGNTQWEKRIFPYSPGSFSELRQTSDGGYIIAAFALTKTDSTGAVEWSINDSNSGYRSVLETKEEGYIALTVNGSIRKINVDGNEEWISDIRDYHSKQEYYSIGHTSDDGYIITGFLGSPKRIRLLKCDSKGNLLWSKYLFTNVENDNYYAYTVNQTNDGGYILGGQYIDQSNNSNIKQTLLLVKTNAKGELQWYKKRTSDNNKTTGFFTIESDRGGIVIVATAKIDTDHQDIWLIKFDSKGKEKWNKFFETNRGWGLSIQQAVGGGFVISGSTQAHSDKNNSNALLIRTDEYGNTDSFSY